MPSVPDLSSLSLGPPTGPAGPGGGTKRRMAELLSKATVQPPAAAAARPSPPADDDATPMPASAAPPPKAARSSEAPPPQHNAPVRDGDLYPYANGHPDAPPERPPQPPGAANPDPRDPAHARETALPDWRRASYAVERLGPDRTPVRGPLSRWPDDYAGVVCPKELRRRRHGAKGVDAVVRIPGWQPNGRDMVASTEFRSMWEAMQNCAAVDHLDGGRHRLAFIVDVDTIFGAIAGESAADFEQNCLDHIVPVLEREKRERAWMWSVPELRGLVHTLGAAALFVFVTKDAADNPRESTNSANESAKWLGSSTFAKMQRCVALFKAEATTRLRLGAPPAVDAYQLHVDYAECPGAPAPSQNCIRREPDAPDPNRTPLYSVIDTHGQRPRQSAVTYRSTNLPGRPSLAHVDDYVCNMLFETAWKALEQWADVMDYNARYAPDRMVSDYLTAVQKLAARERIGWDPRQPPVPIMVTRGASLLHARMHTTPEASARAWHNWDVFWYGRLSGLENTRRQLQNDWRWANETVAAYHREMRLKQRTDDELLMMLDSRGLQLALYSAERR